MALGNFPFLIRVCPPGCLFDGLSVFAFPSFVLPFQRRKREGAREGYDAYGVGKISHTLNFVLFCARKIDGCRLLSFSVVVFVCLFRARDRRLSLIISGKIMLFCVR